MCGDVAVRPGFLAPGNVQDGTEGQVGFQCLDELDQDRPAGDGRLAGRPDHPPMIVAPYLKPSIDCRPFEQSLRSTYQTLRRVHAVVGMAVDRRDAVMVVGPAGGFLMEVL